MVSLNVSQGKVLLGVIGEAGGGGGIGMRPGDAPLWETARPGRF